MHPTRQNCSIPASRSPPTGAARPHGTWGAGSGGRGQSRHLLVHHFGNRDAFIDWVELWYAPSMTSSRRWRPKAFSLSLCPLATFRGDHGGVGSDWWRASAALSTTCLAMRWRAKGSPALSLSLPRRHPPPLIEQVRTAQAAGRWWRATRSQLMIFIAGVGRPAAGDRRQRSPARLAAPEAAPSVPR